MGIFNLSRKATKNVEVVLDIGSNTVGGGIFEKGVNGHANLLYSAREIISQPKTLSGDSLLKAMIKSLDMVLLHLEKYGLKHFSSVSTDMYVASRISVVVSSPWHISESKNVKLVNEKAFTVSKALVQGLIEKEEKEFEQSHTVGKSADNQLEVMEKKVVEITLNGYPTSSPYGKKASELDLKLFVSFSPGHLLQKIRDTITSHFSHQPVEFHSFSLVSYASMRDIFPAVEHFLIIAIGGEVTDITIVKKGIIAEQVSFPLGHNGLLQSLGKICGSHPKCTLESLFALHQSNKVNNADGKKVERAIEETKSAWLELFNGAIASFSSETFLPNTVFLFEDSPFISVFQNFLATAESSRFTISSEPFNVRTTADFGSAFADVQRENGSGMLLSMEANFVMKLNVGKNGVAL